MTGNAQHPPQVAVIGCGRWGKNLIRNYAALGALTAICDRDEERARLQAAPYHASSCSFNSILANPAIDALIIATPAPTHSDLATRGLMAGKHVFVEKPFALSSAETAKISTLAMQRQKILMAGHLMHYHPAFIRLKEMSTGGKLGCLRYIYAHRMNLDIGRCVDNILWDYAPHDISMILSLSDNEMPSHINATAAGFFHGASTDMTALHLRFPSGLQAHILSSCLHPYKEQKLVVIGDKGMAVFNDALQWTDKLRLYPHEFSSARGEFAAHKSAEIIKVPLTESEPLANECAHFLDCIRENRTPLTDGKEALRVLNVLEKAQQALAENGYEPLMRASAHNV